MSISTLDEATQSKIASIIATFPPFADFLAQPSPLILDGGISSHLETFYGATFTNDSLWSSSLLLTPEGCDLITKTHVDFYRKGASIATACCYQCNYNIEGISTSEIDDMIVKAITCANNARSQYISELIEAGKSVRPLYIAGAIGSYGSSLPNAQEYTGAYGPTTSTSTYTTYYKHKTSLLTSLNVDILAYETIPSVFEIEPIIKVLGEVKVVEIKMPVAWLAFSGNSSSTINDKTPMSSVTSKIIELDPTADLVKVLGVNCTPPQFVPGLVDGIRSAVKESNEAVGKRHIVIYPNSGEVYSGISKLWSEPLEDGDSSYMKAMKECMPTPVGCIAVKIIGGCCRISPEEIESICDECRTDNFSP